MSINTPVGSISLALGLLLVTAHLPAAAQSTRIDAPPTAISSGIRLPADIAFPANNGGATIGGKPVGWSRAVMLSVQEAKRIENFRCVFDLSYHVSNLGEGPAGPFSNLVRPVAVEVPAGPAAQEPAIEQTGLILGPRETKALQTEISLAPGSWFIVVKGDAGGQVKEVDETGNNEGRFRVTLAGTCDGTTWGIHGVDYRSYLLAHLLVKDLKVGGMSAPSSGSLHLDAKKLQRASNGKCSVIVDYQVENHGGLATQSFTSAVQVAVYPQPSFQQVTIPSLVPGGAAPAHAVIGVPEGNSLLIVHPVVVTSASGGEQYGTNGLKAPVTVEGNCQGK
jgi:hypothetical protein